MITKPVRGGKLKAKPIVLYPSSEAERELFELQAVREGRALSNFMIHCANLYISRLRAVGGSPAK